MRTPSPAIRRPRANISPAARPAPERLDLIGESERRAGYVEAAEFEQVIRPGFRYVLEEAGTMNGKRLWQVLRQKVVPVDKGSR